MVLDALKILAVIPARGGSKRIPGKNIRHLGGKPLIVWSVDVAKDIPEICDILVSTDDNAIAQIAVDANALCPWLRPCELATDTASSVDVCIHALDWYEAEKGDVDGLLLLQPTSPFRRRKTILRGIEIFQSHDNRPVLGISPATDHPLWCFQIEDENLRPFIKDGGLHLRSQDLPPAYVVNGAYYLISPNDLRNNNSLFGPDMLPLLIEDPGERIDIDTEWDWKLAEARLKPSN